MENTPERIPISLSVSVIIPTYNRPDYLREAIASLLAQTRVPNEIIVVNDGSTDNTADVLSTFQAPVITLHKANGGQASARNLGIERATGDALVFLDDDDTLKLDCIELQALFLEQHKECDVVYGNIMVTDGNGKERFLYMQGSELATPTGNVFPYLIRRNLRPVHAFMVRKSCVVKVGAFNNTYNGVEDYHFWLRIALQCQFGYQPVVVGTYRFHGNQVRMTQSDQAHRNQISIRAEAFEFPAFALLSGSQRALAYSVQGTQCMEIGETRQARNWYGKAIRANPLNPRLYALLGVAYAGKTSFQIASRVLRRVQTLRQRFL